MGVPGAAISKQQLTVEQEIVEGMAQSFVSAVARGRGVEAMKISKLATGRTWLGRDAVALDLIDRVESFESALAGVQPAGTGRGEKTMAKKKQETPEATAEEEVEAQAASPEATKATPSGDPEAAETEQVTAVAGQMTSAAGPAPAGSPPAEERAEGSGDAVQAERERAAAILELARNAGVPDKAEHCITQGLSLDQSARYILDEVMAAGKLGGEALNDPEKLPPQETSEASQEALRGEYERLPRALKKHLTVEQYLAAAKTEREHAGR